MSKSESEIPLTEWSSSWLRIEVANLLKNPGYLIMTVDEKLDQDLPASDVEMREFIKSKQEGK